LPKVVLRKQAEHDESSDSPFGSTTKASKR